MKRGENSNQSPEHPAKTAYISHSIEVLIKKASVDPEFRRLLLDKRSQAAKEINLELSQAEVDILNVIPHEQLEKIIENTKVPPEQKPVFLSTFGKVMLATAVAGTVAIGLLTPSLGHTLTPEQRERIYEMRRESLTKIKDVNDPNKPETDSQINNQQSENHQDSATGADANGK
jgi:hypothetical protein